MKDFFGRHMIVIGFCALTAYSAYLYKHMWGSETAARNTQSADYEMPRPKAYYGEFDLSGRRVQRQVIRPDAENKKAAAVLAKQDGPKLSKIEDAKKAKDKDKDKKKKQAAKKKKSDVRVAVVDGAEGMGISRDSILSQNQNYQTGYVAPAKVATKTETEKTDEAKMSASQWKSLLFAQPTSKNTTEFIAAFKKGHVDATSFYEITQDLLKDTAPDRQKAGLFILKTESSVKGFEILVSEHEQQNDPLKTEILAVIKTYASAAKLPVLSRVLYHSDPVIVKAATEVLTIAVQAQQNQGQGGNNGTPRVNPAAFNVFVPALRRLTTQDDSALATIAQQLLNSIQQMLQA